MFQNRIQLLCAEFYDMRSRETPHHFNGGSSQFKKYKIKRDPISRVSFELPKVLD